LRSDHSILHLRKNRGIKICKLELTFEKQMIVSTCARRGAPVFYTLFETAIAILKDGREFAFAALGNWSAIEENNGLITPSSIP
jgi:hypothetical protein